MQSPQPGGDELGREREKGLADAEIGLLVGIDGGHRHLFDACAGVVHLDEHGTLKEESVGDALKVHLSECLCAYGEESVYGVADVPVARRSFDQETDAHVANASDEGHLAQHLTVEETIAFCEVGIVESVDHRGDEAAIHLAVAIDFYHHIHTCFNSSQESTLHGAADPFVLWVVDGDDAVSVDQLVDQFWRAVGRAVVDQDDAVNKVGQPCNHLLQVLLHFVARYSYRYLEVVEH